jgi:hypothetical protein
MVFPAKNSSQKFKTHEIVKKKKKEKKEVQENTKQKRAEFFPNFHPQAYYLLLLSLKWGNMILVTRLDGYHAACHYCAGFNSNK